MATECHHCGHPEATHSCDSCGVRWHHPCCGPDASVCVACAKGATNATCSLCQVPEASLVATPFLKTVLDDGTVAHTWCEALTRTARRTRELIPPPLCGAVFRDDDDVACALCHSTAGRKTFCYFHCHRGKCRTCLRKPQWFHPSCAVDAGMLCMTDRQKRCGVACGGNRHDLLRAFDPEWKGRSSMARQRGLHWAVAEGDPRRHLPPSRPRAREGDEEGNQQQQSPLWQTALRALQTDVRDLRERLSNAEDALCKADEVITTLQQNVRDLGERARNAEDALCKADEVITTLQEETVELRRRS